MCVNLATPLIDSGSDTTRIDELHIKGKEEIVTVDTAVMKNLQRTEERQLAELRLKHLKNRLKRNDDLIRKYKAVVQEYVDKGYSRKLSPSEAEERSTKTWYLPYHPVLNPNKCGKVRVVFDAVAKQQGTSLNDKLLQ
ncbi:hypothetical protein AC249_AIPGENE12238 [Exaiptasia diaphana]|nr:hypothetical protein AC249_AIPGENE12238 [Exaiptasia diaphana]